MGWRERLVVFGLAATALVGIRYHRRLLHLARRLLTSIHTHTQHHHTEDTDPRPVPTLLGFNFPLGTAYASPNPLFPDPTSFVIESRPFLEDDDEYWYYTYSFYGLLRSFTAKPAIHPVVKVIVDNLGMGRLSKAVNGMFLFVINEAQAPWGVLLSFTPVPRIVKTGPLLGITPDLIGEVDEGRDSYINFFVHRYGLLRSSIRPNGDIVLALGRHVNQDSLITLLRLSPIDYGWEVSAYTSHTVPNRLLAFFGHRMEAELGHFFTIYDDDGVNLLQDPYTNDQTGSYLQVSIEFDRHLVSHRLLSPEEKNKWQYVKNRVWPDHEDPNHFIVTRLSPHRNLSVLRILSMDKEKQLWYHGSSIGVLTLQTLAFLALARKYHLQLDQLASLPRGLESIGIPESIGREYRRQLAWATPQPPLILDLTAQPPVLFTSIP